MLLTILDKNFIITLYQAAVSYDTAVKSLNQVK